MIKVTKRALPPQWERERDHHRDEPGPPRGYKQRSGRLKLEVQPHPASTIRVKKLKPDHFAYYFGFLDHVELHMDGGAVDRVSLAFDCVSAHWVRTVFVPWVAAGNGPFDQRQIAQWAGSRIIYLSLSWNDYQAFQLRMNFPLVEGGWYLLEDSGDPALGWPARMFLPVGPDPTSVIASRLSIKIYLSDIQHKMAETFYLYQLSHAQCGFARPPANPFPSYPTYQPG